MSERKWTRWHSDGWVLTVTRTADGQYFYTTTQDESSDPLRIPAESLTDAQHRAESLVRDSGHRCVARCSFWIPDTPDE